MSVVLDVLASYIENMLIEMAVGEVHKLLGVYGDINKMVIKLKDLKNFIADADQKIITDQSVQEWVRELRLAMYDAIDIHDLCQLKAKEPGPRPDIGCFNPLLFCLRNPLHANNIGNRIKNLNKRLDEIKKRSLDFGFINLGSYEDQSRRMASPPPSRETSPELDESGLVGEKIQEDTRHLVDMLTKENLRNCNDNKIRVFAIVGAGGIGKTTLAQKIFKHETIQQEFPKRVWVSVNHDISETSLLSKAVIEAGGKHQFTTSTKGVLERALKKALNRRKTLLVMDDVWNHQAWESVLKTPLVNAVGQGSCVVITTRHDMVAWGMIAEEPYHHIDKMEPQDAWSLLKKQVIRDENDEPLIEMMKDIGMRILEKCDGLPLAVKVMGGLLRQKNLRRSHWENILNDSIWSESKMHEELNYSIQLSYEDLHSSLKPCFLHYSLLPKGTVFFVQEVVGMWISEGFVHGNSDDLEELGKELHEELIQRNLIEPDKQYTDQRVCKMHDVIRSFAHYVAREEGLVVEGNETRSIDKFTSHKFIRLSLDNKGLLEPNQLQWCSLQPQNSLRTLISVGKIKINTGDSLLAFPKLRTLHIRDAGFDTLAEHLDQLKHLRYLSIKFTNTSGLPENIGQMKFLQLINLNGCGNMLKLPSSITKLQQLRFLNLAGTKINIIPRGFHGLSNLRNLYGFPVHMDGDWCSLEELGPLSLLRRLDISGLENVSSSSFAINARLGDKVHLSYLSLSCTGQHWLQEGISDSEQEQTEQVFDDLCPPTCLENMDIDGYFGRRLPRWMASQLVRPHWTLRILTLTQMPFCIELPDGLCQLPSLELLQIKNAPAIKRVGHEFLQSNQQYLSHSRVRLPFPKLHDLLFEGMIEWEEWEWEEQVKAMPMLELLKLKMCKLKCMPPSLSLHARFLKKLYIYDCEHLTSLVNFASVILLHVFRNTNLERISNLPKLHSLVIIKCPKMKVLKGVPALKRLEMKDLDMETLPGYVQQVRPRFFLINCSSSLLTSIAAGKSSPECIKFKHIQQFRASADNDGNKIPQKCYVRYTKDPYNFSTNISCADIAQASAARINLKVYAFWKTHPIEEEWTVGRHSPVDKGQPLCLRFRFNAYRHLAPWLRQACLHCSEADHMSPPFGINGPKQEYSACSQFIPTTIHKPREETSRAWPVRLSRVFGSKAGFVASFFFLLMFSFLLPVN